MTTHTIDDLKRTSYEMAETLAPTWERRRAFVEDVSTPVREWLVRELAPQPGDTVLELAAGAGDTGFAAAELVGAGGRLISSDFSPAMVDVARRRGTELGVGNVEYRVLDAQEIDLAADSVDGVLCRFGYMLMPDPEAALAETRRVLRPGGRLAFAVWGPPERNPFFTLIGRALVERGHMPPPDPAGPGIFSLGIEERIRALVGAAGFADVRVEDVPVRFAVATAEEHVSVAADTAGPIAMVLRGLSDAGRAELRNGLEDALAPFATARGYEVPGVALAAVAD